MRQPRLWHILPVLAHFLPNDPQPTTSWIVPSKVRADREREAQVSPQRLHGVGCQRSGGLNHAPRCGMRADQCAGTWPQARNTRSWKWGVDVWPIITQAQAVRVCSATSGTVCHARLPAFVLKESAGITSTLHVANTMHCPFHRPATPRRIAPRPSTLLVPARPIRPQKKQRKHVSPTLDRQVDRQIFLTTIAHQRNPPSEHPTQAFPFSHDLPKLTQNNQPTIIIPTRKQQTNNINMTNNFIVFLRTFPSDLFCHNQLHEPRARWANQPTPTSGLVLEFRNCKTPRRKHHSGRARPITGFLKSVGQPCRAPWSGPPKHGRLLLDSTTSATSAKGRSAPPKASSNSNIATARKAATASIRLHLWPLACRAAVRKRTALLHRMSPSAFWPIRLTS